MSLTCLARIYDPTLVRYCRRNATSGCKIPKLYYLVSNGGRVTSQLQRCTVSVEKSRCETPTVFKIFVFLTLFYLQLLFRLLQWSGTWCI